MEANPNRTEAERLLRIAEKQLELRDLTGAKEFANLAQDADPLLEGTDQILAVADVLLASATENRVKNQPNWYQILQIEDPSTAENDLIKKQYRRLALLLHPDKNPFHLADQAFRFVLDAWEVLSTPSKKSQFDRVLNLDHNGSFSKVDLNQKRKKSEKMVTFWTACPYCYGLHEYPRVYLEYCIRCQLCQRAFHAASIPQLPPVIPGKDEYYCCWGFFPMGFVGGKGAAAADANWMPPDFPSGQNGGVPNGNGGGFASAATVTPPPPAAGGGVQIRFDGFSGGGVASGSNNVGVNSDGMPKKRGRGRPRKNQ